MIMKGISAFTAAVLLGRATAAPPGPPARVVEPRAVPTVTISSGTVIGSSRLGTEAFNGIPFALPPVGPLRLKPPVKLNSSIGVFDGTGIAPACPQFLADSDSNSFLDQVIDLVGNSPLFQKALKVSEDCLTVNVIRPTGTKAGDKLPVLFWIFGGGFEVKNSAPDPGDPVSSLTRGLKLGWTSMYDAGPLVANAVQMGKPYIFVAVNYRVGGFGFMPGKEILNDGAANLGLLDQRMGLEWVADNIAAFGGDPDKVTIWGESAGAISVFDQMALFDGNNKYKGKPLFRAGIMNSGSLVPADPVDCPKGQATYNAVVAKAGCAGAKDTLACLRALPYEKFLEAANSVPGILSYSSVALSYLPRPDGKVLTKSPDVLVQEGKYAAVPMIIGDQEDEGTLFSLFQSNTTSSDKLIVDYLSGLMFHSASREQLAGLVAKYPNWITEGSPFRTGIFNEIYPGFKRMAAILGDLVFTLSRRAFLERAVSTNPTVPAWSYLASYNYGTPILGTFHGSDILQVFYGILPNYASKSIQSFYANFVYNMDPNDSSGGTSSRGSKVAENWPRWTGQRRTLIQFYADRNEYLEDDFRSEAAQYISGIAGSLYV